MNRRKLLLGAGALVVGGSAYGVSRLLRSRDMAGMKGMDHKSMPGMNQGGPAARAVVQLPQGRPLPSLARLRNEASEVGLLRGRLTAAPASVEFMLGKSTRVLAYNGTTPGPLIEAFEGDRISLEVINGMPDQPTTVHWHGMPVPADQDGNPMNPIAAGASRDYAFTLPSDSAATYWFHPHPHKNTAEQVYRGLAGVFIVRPKSDPVSTDILDTPLVLTDLRLDPDGEMPSSTMIDLMNGRVGDHVLVNGASSPIMTVRPGSTHRLRILNATNARYFRLAVDDHTVTLIGTDGGLIDSPVPNLREVLLGPAERVELVVTFSQSVGRVNLKSRNYDRGWMGSGMPSAASFGLMTFDVTGPTTASIPLPGKLREIARLGSPVERKRLIFGESMSMTGGSMSMAFLINGKTFDMSRVDLTSRVGAVEEWEIANPTDMDHPFHLHGTQFQVVERRRASVAMAEPFLAWRDTVNVARGETVRFLVRQDMTGTRMYHCHILEHEEQGMMGVLNVTV